MHVLFLVTIIHITGTINEASHVLWLSIHNGDVPPAQVVAVWRIGGGVSWQEDDILVPFLCVWQSSRWATQWSCHAWKNEHSGITSP
jgi:hypothetical protein